MASASSFSSSLFKTTTSSNNLLHLQPQTHFRPNPKFQFKFKIQAVSSKEDIVIVGAGIAGLATAVSLQRLGIGCKVLEQADSLRTGGTSLTLFKNGWRILDAIEVGSYLRPQFIQIKGLVIKTEEGRELRTFDIEDEDQSQEVRAVERRILLETLANQLEPDSISFSSKLEEIEMQENGDTLLRLENGNQISAEVVIACDGIRSPVAKWMGFSEPNYVGHCAIRGLGLYPDGHPFEPRVNYIYGKGVRAAFVPVSPTKVYWFVCFNSSSPGDFLIHRPVTLQHVYKTEKKNTLLASKLLADASYSLVPPTEMSYKRSIVGSRSGPKITDPTIIRQHTKELVKNWSADLLNIIDLTPDDTIIRTPLVDRWLWPAVSPSASKGRVVLVGDAWHPMTPNLGQGACCALEDSIVLVKKLAEAKQADGVTVEDAFKAYEKERWGRIFPLTIKASMVGKLLQWSNPLVCAVRNDVLISKIAKLGPMLQHTNFEFEPLT